MFSHTYAGSTVGILPAYVWHMTSVSQKISTGRVVDGVTVLDYSPDGFATWGIGCHTTEAAAVRRAKQRGPAAIVVHRPASSMYETSWVVGRIVRPANG